MIYDTSLYISIGLADQEIKCKIYYNYLRGIPEKYGDPSVTQEIDIYNITAECNKFMHQSYQDVPDWLIPDDLEEKLYDKLCKHAKEVIEDEITDQKVWQHETDKLY